MLVELELEETEHVVDKLAEGESTKGPTIASERKEREAVVVVQEETGACQNSSRKSDMKNPP